MPLWHRTRTLADQIKEATMSMAPTVQSVYWHPWVCKSTSPSTLSPRIRCPKCKHLTVVLMDSQIQISCCFEILNVPSSIYRQSRRLWTFIPMLQTVLDHVTQTAPPCGSQQQERRPTLPLSSPWWVLLSPHPGPFMLRLLFSPVLPKPATRWQQELKEGLLTCVFSRTLHPISITWVKSLCQQPGQTWKVSELRTR